MITEDLPSFTIWDEKWSGYARVILGPPFALFPPGEPNRAPHGYARMIGETFMYARDNMGIGVRTA